MFMKTPVRFVLAPMRLAPYHAGLVALCLCGAALARLSEPVAFYYGEARGAQGEILTGVFAGTVSVRVNGHECARAATGAYRTPTVNYILRVPLDDGWDTRCTPYAARVGEQLDARITYDGHEFDTVETLPPIGAPATLQQVDLQALPEPGLAAVATLAAATVLQRRLTRDRRVV